MQKSIKLSKYASLMGIHYQTALNHFHAGLIVGAYQDGKTKTIYVPNPDYVERSPALSERTCVYCRVSNHDRRKELDYQVQRCLEFCAANGYKVDGVYKEVASGMNDGRVQLWRMLSSNPTRIIIENKDRLTRFGFEYISRLYADKGEIIVMNPNIDDEHDLIKDMISIVTSFCCRLYGLRRAKNKMERLEKILKENNEE